MDRLGGQRQENRPCPQGRPRRLRGADQGGGQGGAELRAGTQGRAQAERAVQREPAPEPGEGALFIFRPLVMPMNDQITSASVPEHVSSKAGCAVQ